MSRSAEQRQAYAITRAQQRRRKELAPLRAAIAAEIKAVGWRKARPIVEGLLGFEIPRRAGHWQAAIGKRNGSRLLAELLALPRQAQLPLGPKEYTR